MQGDAAVLPFVAGRRDGVWSLRTLPHVPDVHAAVGEVGRVLRPGGLAPLTVALGDGTAVEPVRLRPGAVREFVHRPDREVRAALDDAGSCVLDEGLDAAGRATRWLRCRRPARREQGRAVAVSSHIRRSVAGGAAGCLRLP